MAAPYIAQIEIIASSLNPLMYSIIFSSLLTLSLLSFVSAIFFLLRASRRRAAVYRQKLLSKSETLVKPESSPSEVSGVAQYQPAENNRTRLANSRLYELLLSDKEEEEEESDWEGDQGVSAKKKKKKKKKRGKKKKSELRKGGNDDSGGEKRTGEGDGSVLNPSSDPISDSEIKPELVCLYPFTSTSSATQRKIKQQYDQLVKCNSAKGLTLAQVGEFANCLIEAKNELQHKSEVIKRKFSITKALLLKADRSSFDRLRQQTNKLEMEQKRVEEDALVYNWLQQQLKLSPAYKKVLEISASMELKDKLSTELDSPDDGVSDISFEELLEQEKKDSFWSVTHTLSLPSLVANINYLHIGILPHQAFILGVYSLISKSSYSSFSTILLSTLVLVFRHKNGRLRTCRT
ncbi:unnamed protein product [Thlaspi arvense]|uniref:AT1G17665-like protein n=1 Tax=Thlaspi arvense TaxID=13288 RepID=A0AAU9RC16_THLAR|nr:unnamed protein product [Thlaspi arvense]